MAEISLTIPPRADFVHIPRSVIAGVAASLDFSFDDIEDLRLAVDEACAYLLAMKGTPSALTVSILPNEGGIEVLASLRAAGAKPPPPTSPQGIIWHILGALTDGAELQETPDGPGIRFTKRPAPR